MGSKALERPAAQVKLDTTPLFRWDERRDEPYIQLPNHPDLRIVPMRPGIEDQLVDLFNHKSIGERLYTFPYPFPRYFAGELVAHTLPTQIPIFDALRETRSHALPIHSSSSSTAHSHFQPFTPRVPGCPFKILLDTRSDSIVGSINLKPHPYQFAENPLSTEEVLALPPEEQVWDLGYVLHPELNGRGIMTEMVGTLIDGWIIPYMGIGVVGAFAEFSNPGSVRVLEKNGLELISRHMTEWPISKGGGRRETGRYERRLHRS